MLRLKSAPSVAVSYQHVSDSVYVYVHGFAHPQAFCMRGDNDDIADIGIRDSEYQCDRNWNGIVLAVDRLKGM